MSSLMLDEARDAPGRIADQLSRNAGPLEALGADLRQAPPRGVVTVARGSSDHAASYFAYLCMQSRGIPVASLPPSLSTLARAPWHLDGQLSVAISQSGQSPDLVETQRALSAGGARTLALVNTSQSPLGAVSDDEIAIHAGEEISVAATKSYLATLSACVQWLGYWDRDATLLEALEALPEQLHRACDQDWAPAVEALQGVDRLMVVGRGPGLAVAQEAALKFKETCAIQAEPFSAAEVKHGPMALIGPGYPVLVLAPPGPEQAGLLELVDWLRSVGARVLLAADAGVTSRDLPLIDAGHPALQPLSVIQSFYIMAAGLAEARGSNPDRPRHLAKVTRTR
ncbi:MULTISPECIES: SIS domain-containing protein [unclassified Modicisalibacter]|uniref:SIS domain-containing protein n=1 Tax=unclassified Modicisalibacter TaxID=2679913 RepID=UPI001CCE8A44|nr:MULTISPECIES: SIS domain-containing protein [unclassified Modicisalibacter]MBZ9560048.1 SIS domain-containing protein [Modicisalibacter sp. R2A 31.J]MBZ9575957.1 SIS domain-containing protein [Modicisalibacter sp. MOD 31.J]